MNNFKNIILTSTLLMVASTVAKQSQDPQELLIKAVQNDDFPTFKIAIANGANINKPNNYGATPLMSIAINCSTFTVSPILTYLVSHGANLETQDKNGCTALDYALLGSTPSIVSFLKSKNAPIGKNLLVNAINTNNLPEIKRLLQNGGNPNLELDGQSLLNLIAGYSKDNVPLAKALLDGGANINLKDMFGDSPLINAINGNNPTIVDLLIKYKANLNQVDSDGFTPLMNAVTMNMLPIIQMLIKAGAKTTPQANEDNYLYTALLMAVNQPIISLPVVQALLHAPDSKQSIDLQDTMGQTALLIAAYRGNLPATQALLAAGANPALKNKTGLTALMVAAPNCKLAIQSASSKK